MIPESVQRQLAQRALIRPRADRAVSAGDLRRASSGGEERLVLVLKVNPRREIAQVTLVHSYGEYATDNDVIVEPSVSGLTYPLVVEAGMRGVLWVKDLDRLVAVLPAAVVDACLSSQTLTPSDPGLAVGAAYNGSLEARADFKMAERTSLARLCEDCTVESLGDDVFEFEVDEVFMALLEPSPHAGLMMEKIINFWVTRGDKLVFTLEHLELLDERDLLAVEKWEQALGLDGLLFRMGPLQGLIDRALANSGVEEPVTTSRLGVRELSGAGAGNR